MNLGKQTDTAHRTPHTIFQINLLLRISCITLRICIVHCTMLYRGFSVEKSKSFVSFVQNNSWIFITLAIWWSQKKRPKSSHKWWWSAIGAKFCLKADFKIVRSKYSGPNRTISIFGYAFWLGQIVCVSEMVERKVWMLNIGCSNVSGTF